MIFQNYHRVWDRYNFCKTRSDWKYRSEREYANNVIFKTQPRTTKMP